jgi:DNA-binding phage protein/drug/metabolite transporter superfamily protein YnfA
MAQERKQSNQSNIIIRLREELARRRMSRATLADHAKISLSSLEKSLSGQRPFTDQTLVRVETALGLKFRRDESPANQLAPEHMGSYSRAAVSWIEGSYLTLRPATSTPDAIYAYETLIAYDFTVGYLIFRETKRADRAYAQHGEVSIPHQSGHIYLVTNKHGQHRIAMLSRQGITGELYGLLLTLQQGRGAQLLPVAMPLVLVPMDRIDENPSMGTITRDHPQYAELKARLDKTTRDGFAMMLQT